jgi:membrane-associated phospholipid phosphatase
VLFASTRGNDLALPWISFPAGYYSVANDFFFSGHTAIAVFGATEFARLRRSWLTTLAICLVAFEMATVIVLRAHYTMDVFAGLFAALWVARASERLSAWISPWVRKPPA